MSENTMSASMMSDEIPPHYRALLKDWLKIDLPPHVNPHAIAATCNIPPGSYFVAGGAMLLERQSYLDAVKPLLAAEAIPSSAPPPEEPAPVIVDDGD
jgi:hypothetical protein